jgi:hypothetical protein
MKAEVARSEYADPTGLHSPNILQLDFQAEAAGEQRVDAAAGLGASTQHAATWRASPTSRRSEGECEESREASACWRFGRANGHSLDE